MNHATPAINSRALVIHQAQFGNAQDTFSILSHDVYHHGGKSALGPGRPFGHDEKTALLSILSDYMNRDLEFLDAYCLASSHESLVWYRPRQKTTINVNGEDMDVPMPSLIFMAHKGHLYVAAYKGERRPERDTKLLNCCLPNVGGHGSWCSGGNRIPDLPIQAHAAKIEKMFFLSPFTHWGTFVPSEGDDRKLKMETFFSGLKGKRTFPISLLSDMKVTVSEWMDIITGKRGYYR